MDFVIVNQSTDPEITGDVLLQIAAALSTQITRDFAPAWGIAPGTVSVAAADAGIPADVVPIYIQDALDAPGALGYHDDESNRPVARLGWGVIKQNGGTLTRGSNSLSTVISHEALETLGDSDANEWVLMADGKTRLAKEDGDPCEGNSYPVEVPAVGALPDGSVAMSNFAKPAWFVLGTTGPAGTFDHLGMLTAPQEPDAGGYRILMNADGTVTDVFARTPEQGGMPQWKRAEKAKKAASPGSRHHRRRHGMTSRDDGNVRMDAAVEPLPET